jgi:hypothetical protein
MKFLEIIKDEKGQFSSKRVAGLLCTVMLCITMYHNSFSPLEVAPSTILVESVALLAFGALGLTSAEKFKKKTEDK